MLTKKQSEEIIEHLEKAQNPIFFFDNDCDGLMSCVLLRRYIGRGKGVIIKSFPELDISYVRKISELRADYVFILDKPLVSREFIEEVKKLGLPIVWIDHHYLDEESFGKIKNMDINYYNPFIDEKNGVTASVAYIIYKVIERKEDLWLAVIGCISDLFLPDFIDEFKKEYPELWKDKVKTAFEAYYETEIGKIARILNAALKDRTSNVVSMLNFLFKVKSPLDILIENNENAKIHKRFKQINHFHQKILEKAKKIANKKSKIIYFQYGGELSISADIANELLHLYPKKIIIVAYAKGNKANISIRGKQEVRKMTLKALEGLENATGGGHKNATGATMPVSCLEKFRENFIKAMKS